MYVCMCMYSCNIMTFASFMWFICVCVLLLHVQLRQMMHICAILAQAFNLHKSPAGITSSPRCTSEHSVSQRRPASSRWSSPG